MITPELSPNSTTPLPDRLAQLMDRLRSWFDIGRSPAVKLDQAIAVLLVHAANLGTPSLPACQNRIENLLQNYLRLDRSAVVALIDIAQDADCHAIDIHRFVRVVNRCLPQDDRLVVFAMAAEVAFAGKIGAAEEGFLRLLGGLLGISDHDRGIVQHRTRRRSAAG